MRLAALSRYAHSPEIAKGRSVHVVRSYPGLVLEIKLYIYFMVNFIAKGKQALTIGVATTTIAWTLGLSALAPVGALTLTAGDLVQGSGKAVYWFTVDGKRMPFPNEKVYKSWFADFSKVKKITDAELAAIPLAGTNVSYRPGTRLGKITTDPKTYAVEPGGSLRWIKTEADAKALYGDNWGGWIDDIPDVFFTNYTVGAPLDTVALTNGRVVKTAASSDLYVVWDGKARKIADYAAFTANGFRSEFVGTVGADLLAALPAGTPVAGAEAALTMPAATTAPSTPTTTTPATPEGKNLTVAPDGPAAATHASGTAYNDALKLKFTASAEGDVKITQLVVNRGGFASDSAFTGVGAFDLSTGKRHGNFVTFSDQKATIPMSSDPLVVPAGKTLEVMFRTNVTSAAAGQTGTYSLSVLPAGITTTATVSAPAPLQGATHALTSGANSIADLNVDVVSLTTATVSVDIGQANYELTRFRFSQANGNNDVYLKKLTLFNNGTATDDDISNYKLVDLVTGTELAMTEHSSGRWLTFDMTAKPYLLKKGIQRDLAVRMTVDSGSSRTVQLVIQNDFDIEATSGSDATSGTGILAGAIGTVDASMPIGDITTGSAGFNQATIAAGTLSLEKDTKSPSGLVGIGASNVLVATWKVVAKGEAIELQRADFSLTGTGIAAGDFTGSLRLLVSDVANDTSGQSLYTVTPGNAAGVFDGDAAGTDQVTFSSYYTIAANKTVYVKLVVDTSSTLAATDTIVGNLSNVYFRRVLTNTYSTASSGTFVAGNTLQASAASLSVTRDASLASKSLVEGQSDVVLGSYYFQTGSTEGVNVSSVAVRLTLTDAVDATSLTNLKLWLQDPSVSTDAGKQIGQTTTSISALAGGVSTNTITVSGEVNIPANKTMRVKVLGNLSTGASDGDGTADTIISNIAATGVSGSGAVSGTTVSVPTAAEIAANATVATSATITVVDGGTMTVAVETSGAASSQFVTTGVTGFEMARVKLSSTIEDMKIEQLVLRSVNGSANLSSVKLLGTGLASDPTTQVTSGNAIFSFPAGSELTVPANGSRVLTVQVSTNGLQTLVAGNLGVLGFGTMNARGSGSGVVVQERLTGTNEVAGTDVFAGAVGDVVYFTSTAAAGTNTTPGFYMVTTINSTTLTTATALALNAGAVGTSWTAGDVLTTLTEVFIDTTLASLSTALSVGDLVYFHDASATTNDGFYVVGVAAAAADDLTNAVNELGLTGAADLSAVTYVTATDILTKVSNANGLTGSTMRFEEVEPVIVSKTFTQESQGSEVTVAKYEIKAEGNRDMSFSSLTLEKSGNNSPQRLVTHFKLYDGTTLLSEVTTTDVAGTSAAAITTATAASLEICTGAATAVADEIGLVSANEYAKWAVGDRLVLRQSTGTEITGTITTKGAITVGGCTALVDVGDNLTLSNITGTTHTAADAMTISNYNVHFDASQADTGDTALSAQTITQGQTKTLTVKADLNNVRSGLAAGNNATFSMTVPGSSGPLRLTAATAGTTPGDVEGLNWSYTTLGSRITTATGAVNTTAGASGARTEGDSYPVTGQGLTY